jgi:hypothetical protein
VIAVCIASLLAFISMLWWSHRLYFRKNEIEKYLLFYKVFFFFCRTVNVLLSVSDEMSADQKENVGEIKIAPEIENDISARRKQRAAFRSQHPELTTPDDPKLFDDNGLQLRQRAKGAKKYE